jgi:hypothetical protein
MTIRLVIDCDPGTDDAFAIMLAALHPATELVAVSTVNGNVALHHTTENALRVLDHIGAHVPVFAGADRPFARPDLPIPREVLNADNPKFQVAELALPPSRSAVQDVPAVRMLIDSFAAGGICPRPSGRPCDTLRGNCTWTAPGDRTRPGSVIPVQISPATPGSAYRARRSGARIGATPEEA